MADSITLRDLEAGDAGWVLMRHGELYWQDEGYGPAFEALVAGILADFIANRGPNDRAWIAVDADGKRHGSVFCVWPEPEVAKLRMFLVEPAMRGTGLAQRLLDAVIGHARANGASRLVLWTHESHRAAGRLYARNGFALLAQVPVTAFGQATQEQTWELRL
ncbi:GNAT family N-acetyltransferase [Jannaschia pohangensis]|uniref:N-acetylglutamate synthase, GNAT family n=1 Tax=Jannaschia pohangensis TaxID=390807 RepID=A0A1I3LJB4_9RHOB|nr:GNAT family N-acetyltransferase [Jannaschia pohangensis]SFI84831.1 N-acetylglutamate synthase, GNAT family [Jannaschia pohangensis]